MNEGAVRLDGFGAAGLVPTCKGEARLPSFTIWITSRSLGDRYEASCVAITAGSIYLSILPFIFLSISPFIHRSIYLSLCLCPSPSLSLYARRFLYIDRHACMHTYAAYMYACMHGCMCVCMYVLVYVCVYIYVYTGLRTPTHVHAHTTCTCLYECRHRAEWLLDPTSPEAKSAAEAKRRSCCACVSLSGAYIGIRV